MFRRSILGLLAATGAAALGAAAYTIYKQRQEGETPAPEEVQDEEVRFVDITNEEPEAPAEEVTEEPAPEVPVCGDVPAEEPVPEEPVCEETPAEEPVPEEPVCEEAPAEPAPEVNEAEALRDMDFDLADDVPAEVPAAEEVPAEEPVPEEVPTAEETPAEEPVPEEVSAEEPAEEPAQLDALLDEVLNEETPAAGAEENTAELNLGFGTLGEEEEEPEAAVAEKPYLSEVQQIAALYQYLDKDFVEEMYLRNSQFSEQFPADTLIRISHKCRYEDSEIMREFEKIAVNNGYAAEELNDHETVVSRKMFTEEGSILSDIFNVANQVAALQGNYEGYRID